MIFVIIIILLFVGFKIFTIRFNNPYKLYLLIGQKGSGKSSYLCKIALKYIKKGWFVYTNMADMNIPNVRVFDANNLGDFVPVADSVILLDEVGMIYDNRNFKSFKSSVRDFFKLQRHYKVLCYMNSQSYDIDIKLRALCDRLMIVTNLFSVFSLVRPVKKVLTVKTASPDGSTESRITEDFKFCSVFDWQLTYLPKYAKYFNSFVAPELPDLPFIEVQNN